MSVTVDRELLAADALGLRTLGQVLSHIQRDNRLVVQLLIDGQEPPTNEMGSLRARCIDGHTVYIETADPRLLALEVLEDVLSQLESAERLRVEAAELLQKNATFKALEQLGGCLRIWQHAQNSVSKTAALLRLDLSLVRVDDMTLAQQMEEFAGQLRNIKSALEQRDYVSLADSLLYETSETSARWQRALEAVGEMIRSLR